MPSQTLSASQHYQMDPCTLYITFCSHPKPNQNRKENQPTVYFNSVLVRLSSDLPEFLSNFPDFFRQLLQHFLIKNLVDLSSYSLPNSTFSLILKGFNIGLAG